MLQQSGNVQYLSKDLRIHDKAINTCTWSGGGKYLGVCFQDKHARICQLEPSGIIRSIQTIPCSNSIRKIVWNPHDNQRFAIVGSDKVIELWDVRAPRPTSKIPCLCDNVDASWSPDGAYIVTGNYSNQLCVFDTREMKMVKKMPLLYEVHHFGRMFAWSLTLCTRLPRQIC